MWTVTAACVGAVVALVVGKWMDGRESAERLALGRISALDARIKALEADIRRLERRNQQHDPADNSPV